MHGLLERDLEYILKALANYPEIEEAIIFGSRAIGNYKKGSDIDIALKGKNLTYQTLISLNDDLNEEYPLPYFFDVINYHEISNEELKSHIDKVGVIIYKSRENCNG